MHFFREAVEAGGLLSLGPDSPLLYRNAGVYVDKKPADLPVAQPRKYTSYLSTSKPPRRWAWRSPSHSCCERIGDRVSQ